MYTFKNLQVINNLKTEHLLRIFKVSFYVCIFIKTYIIGFKIVVLYVC